MRRSLIPIALVLSLTAAACSGGSEETTTTTPPVDTSSTTVTVAPTTPPTVATPTTLAPTTTTTTEPVDVSDQWPLTGEPGFVEDTSVLFVKVDNTTRGRPQAGLDKADLVFEIVVEGGVSRLLAGFQSEVPDVVGPVRSIRETDARLLFPFAAYFANSGGQSFVETMVNEVSRDVGHPELGSRAYFRAPDRPSVYDLMFEPAEAFERRQPLTRPNLVRLDFGPAPAGGQPATTVTIDMSRSQQSVWEWSPIDGAYLRFNGTSLHRAESGEQILAANVVAIEVEQILLERTDSAGSRVPDYRIAGSGPLTFFRDGMAFTGTWERDHFQRTWFRFKDATGAEIPFAVGSTWIEVVPAGQSVTFG